MNSRTAPVASDLRLHAMIEASVRNNPETVAVADGRTTLTYAQLDARAEAAALRLRALGAGPGTVVGLAARRRADTIAALVGILKAGAAYCPLDPAYPLERLRFMLADSGAVALAAGREDVEKLSDPARPTLLLDGPAEQGLALPAAPARAAGPSDLAYVIYTSGSTGKPKGVMVEHASAANYVRAMIEIEARVPGERVLQFSSMSFDASITEIFPALSSGATMFLRDDAVPSACDLIRTLEVLRIERLFLPTAYFHELAAALSPLGATLPACLRSVVLGGEAVRGESLSFWRPAASRVRLLNVYGPTETTVGATIYDVPADAPSRGVVPIGTPLAGAELHVVDPDGRPVRIGEAGELWIGGPGVARGYLNRPELTAARFLPDPFSGRPGDRVYRTGDRARRRRDGVFEYLGRFDHQVKVRGHRVELGEVESALAAHPAVGTCAVVLREERSGAQRLVAYVSPGAGKHASAEELRAYLLEKIPEYMVPAAFVALDALPLTPGGKVDRGALPSPSAASPVESIGAGRERAATLLERQIRDIWEEVLGVSPIGLRDDFFALGGHSLLAVRVIARLEKAIGRRPPLAVMCEGVTIERLGEALWEHKRAEVVPIVRFGPEAGSDPFFFIHPGLGGLYCRELSRAMPDTPFYLLGGQNLTGLDPIPTIEEIAGRYLETIRSVNPKGPYRLGGYSIGCTIAYEMARQLEAAGERIPKLMLVAAPIEENKRWWRAARRGAACVRKLSGCGHSAMLDLFNLGGKSGQLAAGLFGRRGAARLRGALSRARSRVAQHRSIAAFRPNAGEFNETLRVLIWAWAGYRPGPYRGPVTLIEVEDPFDSRKPLEFVRLSPSVERIRTPWDHESIVTTHAAELGAEISRLLA